MLDLNVEQKIKKEVKESFVASILLLAFAVVLMINPDNFLNIAINVFGYLGIFFGVINVFIFYRLSNEARVFSKNLMNGIILIFYGIIAIIETNILKEMVTILLGGYLIFKSSSRFQLAINIKNDHSKTWIWLLILAIISLIIGFLMILNPLPSLMKINAFIAWLLIISEIINIIENIIILIGIRKNEKENK